MTSKEANMGVRTFKPMLVFYKTNLLRLPSSPNLKVSDQQKRADYLTITLKMNVKETLSKKIDDPTMNTTPIALSLITKKWRDEEGSRIPVVGKFLSHYLVRSGDKKKVQEFLLTDPIVRSHRLGTPPAMRAKYIIPAVLGSFAVAWAADHYFADKKIFGGSTPSTVANKEWWEETDKKFQAWPRTAGPPVVMNPISRQNFIVKSRTDS